MCDKLNLEGTFSRIQRFRLQTRTSESLSFINSVGTCLVILFLRFFSPFLSRFIRFRFIGDTFFRFINWGKIRSFCFQAVVFAFVCCFDVWRKLPVLFFRSIKPLRIDYPDGQWFRTFEREHCMPSTHLRFWVHQLWKMMLSFVISSKFSTSSSAKLPLPRGPSGNKLVWAKRFAREDFSIIDLVQKGARVRAEMGRVKGTRFILNITTQYFWSRCQ